MTGLCYRDAILDVYFRPYAGAIGPSSSLWTTTLDHIVPGWMRSSWEYLQQETIVHMDWPACSPDLNPIERVWNMLQVTILRRPVQPTNLVELENVLIEEWNNIEMAAIQRIIGSMSRRCQTVIASRGSHTSY